MAGKTMQWSHKDKINGVRPLQPGTTKSLTTRPLHGQTTTSKTSTAATSASYDFGNYGYGKDAVKLLHVERRGTYHKIREYEVCTHLRLNTRRDYLEGDNQDIIATDSQKNTVYVLAKKVGIKSPEQFGLLLCGHFLQTYRHVDEVEVLVDQYPWERLRADGAKHNHAFVFAPSVLRFATVTQKRNESPRVTSGLGELRVLKTTQSSFTDFIQDGYRTLPDAKDRIFSTVIKSNWDYSTVHGVDFDKAWFAVKDCILETFAGHPEHGIYSPSVQNTLYLAERMVLDQIPQVNRIEMRMPNKHYFTVDMSKFSSVVGNNGDNQEVYMPVDKPAGIIYAELYRNNVTPKL